MHHRAQTSVALQREIAYVIKRHIADPRVKNITVTAVKLSKKLDYADVSVTQLEARFTHTEILKGFDKAASKIRYHLSQEFARARRIPKLRFHYDTDLEKSTQLHQLINQCVDSSSNSS